MSAISFPAFEQQARASGFDQVLQRQWPALHETGTHTHPFEVRAVVVQGEFWLTVGEQTRHLRAGDTFELQRDVAHAERYGPDGATYWVARRS